MQVDSDAGSAPAVDPALLSGLDAEDSDYEYEYDETETEVDAAIDSYTALANSQSTDLLYQSGHHHSERPDPSSPTQTAVLHHCHFPTCPIVNNRFARRIPSRRGQRGVH